MSILSKIKRSKSPRAFASRMHHLERKGYDTSLYIRPIHELEAKFKKGVRSLVVYGEPQSGKTEFMISLVCKLIDLQYRTIFIILNDNTELETQNYKRFKEAQQIKPSPLSHYEFINLEDYDKKSEKPRIIFCRKNSSNLKKLIEHARFLKDRVIIDDEADYASPDTKVNKDGDPSVINKLVGELGQLAASQNGKYIGVTATPGRLDLNNTFFNETSEWIFLEPHANYKGRKFFFPYTEEEKCQSDYQLVRLPDQNDSPRYLRDAFLRYLVRVAILNLDSGEDDFTPYSMLIHTDGSTFSHEEDQRQINQHIHVLTEQVEPKIETYLAYMQAFAEKEIVRTEALTDSNSVLEFILDEISRNSVLVINNKNSKQNVDMSCNPVDLFTIAIGGNIVSRGLTFNNLLTFFFSRGVKGKMQQNTYIQRARMFGTRPYHSHLEICAPDTLFADWATCFIDHELSLQFAKQGDYVHIHSSSNTPSDNASIDKSTVVQAKDEWLFGSVFPVSEKLELLFSQRQSLPLDFLESIINSGEIPRDSLPSSILNFIRQNSNNEQADVAIVLRSQGGFVDIENYKDLSDDDKDQIVRKRGGLVSSTINKRSEFDKMMHLIVPVKNRRGYARFYYKHYLGKRALYNMRKH